MLEIPSISLLAGAALVGVGGLQAVRSASRRRSPMQCCESSDRPNREPLIDELAAALRWARASQTALKAWTGTRVFCVSAVVDECRDCRSYYLVPQDGRPLPTFEPGQYLTFHLRLPHRLQPVVRCYSLSERPRDDYYRITVKRVQSPKDRPELPPGLASNYFHGAMAPGSLIDAEAPQGMFFIDPADRLPIVLVGAGIGVTPLVSMASALGHAGDRRIEYFFAGFRHGGEQPLALQLRQIAAAARGLTLDVGYSQPRSVDALGVHYHHCGRADIARLRRVLPSNNFRFYLCGPPAMMESLAPALLAWGVPKEHVHFEAFGPASVRGFGVSETSKPCRVSFARSGKTLAWTGAETSLLGLAEKNGLPIESGCRAGNCGQCRVKLLSGSIQHAKRPGTPLLEGECLACIAAPQEDVTLDS